MPSTRKTMWVIFAGPQQFKAPGTRYTASDGTVTDIKSKAKKFYGPQEAKEFAEEKHIDLSKGTRYIGQDDFTDFEIQMGDR
jgi:hypothetical protein